MDQVIMTPQEQRIAIAEACGWTVKRWTDGEGNSVVGLLPPGVEKTSSSFRHSPDYLNDLNAMHEAEMVLKHQQWPDYWNWLFVASTRQSGTGKAEYKVTHATAAQRAEAFLRTIGKWEESE